MYRDGTLASAVGRPFRRSPFGLGARCRRRSFSASGKKTVRAGADVGSPYHVVTGVSTGRIRPGVGPLQLCDVVGEALGLHGIPVGQKSQKQARSQVITVSGRFGIPLDLCAPRVFVHRDADDLRRWRRDRRVERRAIRRCRHRGRRDPPDRPGQSRPGQD